MKKFIIHTDGGARGNPGPAGIGISIEDTQGNIIGQYGEYIGETTNNQAEYQAVLVALQKAKELGGSTLMCYLDSQLVVEQLNRNYKVKNKNLIPLFIKTLNAIQNFHSVTFTYIPREQNTQADRLVNKAIDAHRAS